MDQKNQIQSHEFGEIGNSSKAVMTYITPKSNTNLYIAIALIMAYLALKKERSK